MTALHWAAKRNHILMMTELINFGNFIDARDYAGRTPLFIAARSENLDALRLLVLNKADPYIGSITGKLPINTTRHSASNRILQRAMLLATCRKMCPKDKKDEVW
jgi:ankyrin repeat protein